MFAKLGKVLIVMWLYGWWFCLVLGVKQGVVFDSQVFRANFATLQLQSYSENVLHLGITQASLVLRSVCYIFAKLQRKCAAPRHNASKFGSALGLLHFCKVDVKLMLCGEFFSKNIDIYLKKQSSHFATFASVRCEDGCFLRSSLLEPCYRLGRGQSLNRIKTINYYKKSRPPKWSAYDG